MDARPENMPPSSTTGVMPSPQCDHTAISKPTTATIRGMYLLSSGVQCLANNDADTYDDIIEVGVQPRYVAGVKRLNGFGRGRACGLRNCKAGERENEHRAHDDG